MGDKPQQFLVLRSADRFEQTITDYDHPNLNLISCPVIDYHVTKYQWPSNLAQVAAVLITSIRSVQNLIKPPPLLFQKPVFIVGSRSALLIKEIGFDHVRAVGHDFAALLPSLRLAVKAGNVPILYLRGDHIRYDMSTYFENYHDEFIELITYGSQPVPSLPTDVLQKIKSHQIDGIIFFSPAQAHVFINLIENADLGANMQRIKALCLSQAVLHSLQYLNFARCYVAPTPDLAGMQAIVNAAICEKWPNP